MLLYVGIYMLLSVVDAVLTAYGVNNNIAGEANIYIEYLISKLGTVCGVTIGKLSTSLPASLLLLLIYDKKPRTCIVIIVAAIIAQSIAVASWLFTIVWRT